VTLFVDQAVNLRQRASQVAGFAAFAIAATAFVGWWASAPLLSGGGLAVAIVKPTTALCLAALGLALMHSGADSRFVFAVCFAVAVIAALDLLDLFGIDLGIDRLNRLLVPSAVPVPEGSFHMINGVPVSLLPTAGSFALSRFERHRFAATALSGVVGVIAMFALFNYLLTGSRVLYGTIDLPTPLTSIGLFCVVGAMILRFGTIPALRKPRPLWQLLVVLGCAIITPLLLFGVYMGLHITDAELQDIQNHLTSEARALSADIDREIVGEMKRLQALAAAPSLRRGDLAEFQRQAEASLALHQSGNVVLVDRNMQQLVNIWVPFGTPLEKTAVPEAVERALTTGKPQITGLFTGPVSHQLLFGVVVPVAIDGENRYVLNRSVDQRVLAALVAAHELPPGWQAVISDAMHRIVALSQQEGALIGTLLPEAQWRGVKSGGVFEFVDSEGRSSMEASVRSELTGWQTAVWAPTALLESRVRTLWWAISFASLLAFALVLGFALWLGRIVTRSVSEAARATIALKKGSVLPLGETPVAEFETLIGELRETAAELRETAAKRQAAERDLQASRDQLQISKDQLQLSKDRLQLAFDATELGWWQYDPCRSAISVDARFKKIFDVGADEISPEDLANRVHPDDAERFWTNREAALDPANPKPYVHQEYRVRQRDGAVRWVESHGVAYFAGTGPERRVVSFGGTVQDITERKEREEKEHLLMREINHRAKNMLSVVDSIAHQTATRSPEDFVERFSERIQALSANQDLLVRNEWRGVDVEDLVRAQLAHFADLIGSRIAMHGPKLRLNPASAQAIGLALHELATNAGKYGALSTDMGRVDISWGMTDDDTFTMSWVEREGPPVPAPKGRGFGSIVMQAMAERSVAGTVDLDYAPSGMTWRLRCPATNACESEWRTASDIRTARS
jgi:PAS domain S-box-containing protein